MGLTEAVRDLRCTEVSEDIARRVAEFSVLGRKGSRDWFVELCFCIMTANFNAERAIRIQQSIGDGFITLDEEELAARLRALGHRFPRSRANYIVRARSCADDLKEILEPLGREERREWLVNGICGLGYKEASHFLRNTGHFDYAIIDFHILDLLEREGIVAKPRTLSRPVYLSIEDELRSLAVELSMPLGVLDLYLWFLETGRVLK